MRAARLPGLPIGLALLLGVLAGCGGKGSTTGDLDGEVAERVASYHIIELASGALDSRAEIADLASNPAYRTTHMVFRKVPSGGFYCGVFEVTQAQWLALAGTQPWLAVSVEPIGAAGDLSTVDDKPAFAVSPTAAEAAIAAHNDGKSYQVQLPSDSQWEAACRGGSATAFSWGGALDDYAGASGRAVVRETLTASAGVVQLGPQPVGSCSANPYGLFDVHGNVWELTAEGNIRGGSWSDPLSQAGSAASEAIHVDTAHLLVGLRLVLVP